MKIYSILITSFALASLAFAKPDYSLLASSLYPTNVEEQLFVSKFFDIVEAHKTQDPLLEGRGPSLKDYSLDKIKFAFITNIKPETVDLVFFNWNLPLFKGLEVHEQISELYKSNVYILKNVSIQSIATQGQNRSQLTNFSYILGANTMARQILNSNAAAVVPPDILDWKPHPNYMSSSHPLRQTLDGNTLVILSPNKELLFQQTGMSNEMRPVFEQMIKAQGGFYNMIMGMMVHEIFHVKEGEDHVNQYTEKRSINENRKLVVQHLQSDKNLRSLVETYVRIVFSIADSLKNENFNQTEAEQLSDLSRIIMELKNNHTDTWKYIWNYEYTEGFAEYVSAYSMIQVGITTFDQQIESQKTDKSNNFVYRSGAIGGLYLIKRLSQMPFSNNEDHFESIWEIVLRLSNINPSENQISELTEKYNSVSGIDGENEIKRITDYLISTVLK